MSLLGLTPKLCVRALPARPATRLCRAAACRTFTTSPFLLEASKPPKRPGLLSRIKWYKGGNDARGQRAAGSPLALYEELPPTYRDRDGLPFAKRDLTPAEVAKIFGPRIKPEFANSLLRIMHGRRVAGTLEDPAFKANTARFTSEQKDAALKYLRETVPVDETMNKGLRAQDELEQLEKEIAGMKEGGGQTEGQGAKQGAAAAKTPDTTAKEQEASQEEPELEVKPRGNAAYGVSALDRIRARNVARIKAEEKRIEEERKEKGEPVAGTLEAYVDRGAMSPRMQKWQEKGGSGLQEPPELTLFERLAGPLIFGALLVAACVGFAAIYEPPEDHDRVFWDISPELATIGTLMALNVAVYAFWKVPPMWRFLNNNFLLVVAMPRSVTLLTSQFSHQGFSHLAMNMATLYYIGCRLHEELGRANFLALYLGSGTIGYMAGVTLHGLGVASLGASGSILGITAAYFYLHARDKFRIFGFPAAPSEGADGWVFLVSVILLNVISGFAPAGIAVAQTADTISHLGGMFAGMGMVHLLRDIVGTFGAKGGSGSGSEGGGAGEGREGERARGEGEKRRRSLDLWGASHWP